MKSRILLLKERLQVLESSGKASRILAMEGIRGYAVLLVFLVHQDTLFRGYLAPGSSLARLSQFCHYIGNSGVDQFFVLSGFLIYGNLINRPQSFGSFLSKRVRRIYPTFLCVFAIYVVLSYLEPAYSKIPAAPQRSVLYLVENLLFMPGSFPIEPLIPVRWSLSFEFFFYLSLPLLIGGLGMREWKRSGRVAFFLALLTLHCVGYGLQVLPHIRLVAFIAGVLLWELNQTQAASRLSSLGEMGALLFYAAVFLIPFSPRFGVVWNLLLAGALFALTLFSFAFHGVLNTIFRAWPIRWLGNMSYSFFLLHGLILNGIAAAIERMGFHGSISVFGYVALAVLNLAIALVGSFLIFFFVEKPWSLDAPKAEAHRSFQFASSTIAGVLDRFNLKTRVRQIRRRWKSPE